MFMCGGEIDRYFFFKDLNRGDGKTLTFDIILENQCYYILPRVISKKFKIFRATKYFIIKFNCRCSFTHVVKLFVGIKIIDKPTF